MITILGSLVALWLLLALITIPIDLYEHRRGRSVHVVDPIYMPRPYATPSFANASPMSEPSVATVSPPSRSSTTNLVVKGLYIGMSGEGAARVIVMDGKGRITVRPTTEPKPHGYDIMLQSPGRPDGTNVGWIVTEPSDQSVRQIIFTSSLSDYLFDTSDQSAEEFAQTFINSYGVPTLKPTTVSGARCWSYVSPYGWTLRILPDKSVDLLKTPDRSFD